MTLIIFIIFTVIILGVMFLLAVVRGVSSFVFGKPSYTTGNKSTNYYNSTTGREEHYNASKSHKKVFAKDEGEYVSYEEIKE